MTEVYDTIGPGYAARRHPDPRIAKALRAALDGCRTVVNVGAGTGSYEPDDLDVVAVEPSLTMIRQRRHTAAPAVQGRAEAFPFRDSSFDAVLGVLTLHHWADIKLGLTECARSARRQGVFLTLDVEASGQFWLLQDYFPDIHKIDQEIFPSLDVLESVLGPIKSLPVNIPADCVDGFLGAYWRRPEAYLDPAVRAGMSTFSKIADVDERIEVLRQDLTTGKWARRHRNLLSQDSIDLGYRIVTARLS
jgi:SAM-dependent methyltransferase